VLDFLDKPEARALQPDQFFAGRVLEELQNEGACTDGRVR
jgi:hypothetical protein